MPDRPAREVRIAPNIFKTPYGWRVYLRRGAKKSPVRFPPSKTIEELILFRDQFKLESKKLRRERRTVTAEPAGGFARDADAYLALASVKAMPSIATRKVQIAFWKKAFGTRPRSSITARDITEQLHALKAAGYSGSTVNKYRTALMSLWTQLDGRSAANPVRDAETFQESALEVKGQPMALLMRILRAMPRERSRPAKGVKGSRDQGNASRARLEVLIWTGMDPSQLSRMHPADVNLRERWYVTPARLKGARRARTPRPQIRKPMVKEAVPAFRRLLAMQLLGTTFGSSSLLKAWLRGLKRLEEAEQEKREDPAFRLPHIDLKDLRHSFGTELLRRTKDLQFVGMMLDHAPGSPMTLRYSLAAVPNVLKQQAAAFDAEGPQRRKGGGRRA